MRVSSGTLKGKSINTPDKGIKPTSEKVRLALVNMLKNRIINSSFLDLYAGAGAVGIEAMSNGASLVYFVEKSEKNYKLLKSNLQSIAGENYQYKTFRHNASNLGEILKGMEKSFDIIFADPYYDSTFLFFDSLFDSANIYLKDNGLFILEHSSKSSFENNPGFIQTKDYGGTCLSIFNKKI